MQAMATQEGAGKEQGRYPIIDALRFVLAFWVTMDHLGAFPLFAGADLNTRLGRTLIHGWRSLFWGVPAVIGFFTISGFCIHLPYKDSESLPIGRYYARRYIRILLPVFGILFAFHWSDVRSPIFGRGSLLWKGVLWSLACEELYYAVYPLTHWIRTKNGWTGVMSGTFAIGIVASFLFPNALDGSLLGTLQIAVILYPVWLLGCLLAEDCNKLGAVKSGVEIWAWRLVTWLASWICLRVHFDGNIPLGATLLPFGVLTFFWIRKELAYGKQKSPLKFLASAGLWSYSLYLVHVPGARYFLRLHVPSFGYIVDWSLCFGFVLAVSYLFYLCVEKPSHKLARKISTRKSRPPKVAELVRAPAAADSFPGADSKV